MWKKLAISLILILGLTPSLFATQLTDVRTGYHGRYSRIVIELTRPVKYEIIKDTGRKRILVDLHAVDAISPIGAVELEPEDPILQQVRYYKNSRRTTVSVSLLTAEVVVKSYHIDGPFRVILDIYMLSNPDTAGRQKMSKPVEKAAQTPKPEIEKQQQSGETLPAPLENRADSGLLDSTLFALRKANLPVDAMLNRTRFNDKAVELQAVGSEAGWSPSGLFYVLLALFVIFDLGGFFWYLKRRNARKVRATRRRASSGARSKAPGSANHRNGKAFVEVLKESLDVAEAPAPDAKNAPEMRNAKVKAPLNDLAPEQEVELQEINSTIKIDSFIASLSQAVETATIETVTPPDLNDVAHDLDVLTSANISRELTREQIMGRDGRDFIRNIKRLYMS